MNTVRRLTVVVAVLRVVLREMRGVDLIA